MTARSTMSRCNIKDRSSSGGLGEGGGELCWPRPPGFASLSALSPQASGGWLWGGAPSGGLEQVAPSLDSPLPN